MKKVSLLGSLVEMENHRCQSLPNSNKVEGGALA